MILSGLDYSRVLELVERGIDPTDVAGTSRGAPMSETIRDLVGSVREGFARVDSARPAREVIGWESSMPRDVTADLEAVLPLLAAGQTERARTALDMIAATGRRSIEKLTSAVQGSGVGADFRDEQVAARKVAVLKSIAVMGQSDDGTFEAGSLHALANDRANQLMESLEACRAVREISLAAGPQPRPAYLVSATARLTRPGAEAGIEGMTRYLESHVDRAARERLVARLVTIEGDDPDVYRAARVFAERIHAIDEPDRVFRHETPSHAVLGELFDRAGEAVRVGGAHGHLDGRICGIRDDGATEPTLRIATSSGVYSVPVTGAMSIGADAQRQTYDGTSTRDGSVPLTTEQRSFINAIRDKPIAWETRVHREKLLALAATVASGVDRGQEMLTQSLGWPGWAQEQVATAIVADFAKALPQREISHDALQPLTRSIFCALRQAAGNPGDKDIDRLASPSLRDALIWRGQRSLRTLDLRSMLYEGPSNVGEGLLDLLRDQLSTQFEKLQETRAEKVPEAQALDCVEWLRNCTD